jgi:hypothetical protein
VPESLIGQNLVCPNCKVEFFATPPETLAPREAPSRFPAFMPPTKLPFFKSGKIAILEQRLQELLEANGQVVTQDANDELNKDAIALGLDESAGTGLLYEHFLKEFEVVKKGIMSSLLMTDNDVASVEQLKTKYNVHIALPADYNIFRAIYLLETTGKLPNPIQTTLMLDGKEVAHYAIPTIWHQTRVHSHGYSGTSVSIPSGIKGVSFRFGSYTPNRTEDITPLSSGTLYVTSARLLFNGELRNTTVALKKIVNGTVYSDALGIEKSTGKPDFFTMPCQQARYILSLLGVLKA